MPAAAEPELGHLSRDRPRIVAVDLSAVGFAKEEVTRQSIPIQRCIRLRLRGVGYVGGIRPVGGENPLRDGR